MNVLPVANISGEVLNREFTNISCLDYVPVLDVPDIGKRQQGYFTLSNFRIRFHREQIREDDASNCNPIINIPLGFIRDIRCDPRATKYEFVLITRLTMDLVFEFRQTPKTSSSSDAETKMTIKQQKDKLIKLLIDAAFPLDTSSEAKLFAYLHKKESEPDPGWKYYNGLRHEYKRILDERKSHSQFWRVEENTNYCLIDSYPEFFYVPEKAKLEDLRAVKEFRTKGRIPVLSWCHPNKGSVIARSSQPRTGVGHFYSSTADQSYIEMLRDSSLAEQLTIADARPKRNAIANMAKGGGTEAGITAKSQTGYTAEGRLTNVKFFEIDNIHVVRGSFEKLKNLLADTKCNDFHEKLEKTGWLAYIQRILFAGVAVAEKIECESQSVLVHCSDGWDRTAQIVSLAMLMLDPFYRTMEGFATLIEKEWTAFGHKFSERNGTCRQSQEKEESPIFLQFIECVWQMWIQFRHAFEFNELFLIKILDGFYSNQYGTFLYSSDKERQSHLVGDKTKSIWTDLLFDEVERRGLLNPLFNRNFSKTKGALLPSVSTRAMKLWRIYYFRHNPLYCPRYDLRALNLQLLSTVDALRQTEIQRKNQQQKMKASVQSVPTQQQGKVDSRRALNLAALSSTNVNGQPLSSPGLVDIPDAVQASGNQSSSSLNRAADMSPTRSGSTSPQFTIVNRESEMI